jgi:hypothetical protein
VLLLAEIGQFTPLLRFDGLVVCVNCFSYGRDAAIASGLPRPAAWRLRHPWQPERVCPARGIQDPEAFAPGGGDQPAGQRVRVAEPVQLVHQAQRACVAGSAPVGAASNSTGPGPDAASASMCAHWSLRN